MTEGADKDSGQDIGHSSSPAPGINPGGSDDSKISSPNKCRSMSLELEGNLQKTTNSVDVVDTSSISSSTAAEITATEPEVNGCQGDGSAGGENSRRHSKSSSLPHGAKLCPESSNETEQAELGTDPQNPEDTKWAVLEAELKKAQSELKAKDEEVEKLKGIRQQVEGELTDLTAALFEEAHKMVQEAKMKEVTSEKNLKEAKMQLDGLQAEVAALKTLLITSTPSRPNLGNAGGNGISIFKKQHKRCPSHNHLQYGRNEDEPDGARKPPEKPGHQIDRARCEIDPILHSMFAQWREDPVLSLSESGSKFLQQVYAEDINPCLTFRNEPLVQRLRKAVEENSIWLEPVPEKQRSDIPTECALICCPRICHYRMRFSYDSEEWYNISRICRDRIAAVCEFLNYLRYIQNGLVKASVDDAYWEVIRLRKQIALAKLGIPIEQS